ncbi:MAG: hypothetical protein IJJ99_02925 [Oscillospiraceae bacterium]|nr:hypothetical protein [Oscillospiraceae bacterium]
MDIKKIVENICCDYTHATLIDLCRFYFTGMKKKDPQKAKRYDLDQIAFIILSLNIDPAGIYAVYTDDRIILECAFAHQTVDYVFKNTLYCWADEPEYPVTKDSLQQRVYVRRIATKTI